MIEVGIIGAKNAGKTTLVVEMTRLLVAAGERVATVKHTSHDHTFDTEGKDSHQHRCAGAALTLAASDSELALFAVADRTIHEAVMAIVRDHCDWCLVEGDKHSARPKILVMKHGSALKGLMPANIIVTYGDERYAENVPHFGCRSLREMIEFVRRSSSAWIRE